MFICYAKYNFFFFFATMIIRAVAEHTGIATNDGVVASSSPVQISSA